MLEQRYSDNKLHERRKYKLTSEYTRPKTIKQIRIEKEQIDKPKLKVIDIDMDNADDNETELDQ